MANTTYGPKLGKLINANIGDYYPDDFRALLRTIDALVQGSVIDIAVANPPSTPSNGDAYIVPSGASGVWSTQANNIAVYSIEITTAGTNTKVPGWEYYTPKAGWEFYVTASSTIHQFNGTAWIQPVPYSGVTSDGSNGLNIAGGIDVEGEVYFGGTMEVNTTSCNFVNGTVAFDNEGGVSIDTGSAPFTVNVPLQVNAAATIDGALLVNANIDVNGTVISDTFEANTGGTPHALCTGDMADVEWFWQVPITDGFIPTWSAADGKWKATAPTGGAWGDITGILANQTDLETVLTSNATAIATETTRAEAAEALTEKTANKGVANGYASLDGNGKLVTSEIPALAIVDTWVVASQPAMLSLAAHQGDVAIRSDINETLILSTTDPTQLANWKQILTPASPVQSVDGQVGIVSLTSRYDAIGTSAAETARAEAAEALLAPKSAPYKSVSTNYSILTTDGVIFCTAGAGGITITLPNATAYAGRSFTMKQVDAGTGGVSIITTSSQSIDALVSYSLVNQSQFVTVMSDGNNWQVIGAN